MDTTPIYTELQQKLIDPEANNWGPSAPPEFAEELSEHEERPNGGNGPKSESGSDDETGPKSRNGNAAKKSGRSRGRRHRAED